MIKWEDFFLILGLRLLLWFFVFCLLVPDWTRGGNGRTTAKAHGVLEQSVLFRNLFFHHLIWVPFGLGVGDWIQGHVHVRSMLYQWASPTVYNDLITSRLHFFSSFLYPSLPPSLPLSLSYIRTQPSCPGFLISVGLYCVISFLLPHSSSPPFMRHGLSLRIRLGWNLAILLS